MLLSHYLLFLHNVLQISNFRKDSSTISWSCWREASLKRYGVDWVISAHWSSDWLIALQRSIIVINNSTLPETVVRKAASHHDQLCQEESCYLAVMFQTDFLTDNAVSCTDGCIAEKYGEYAENDLLQLLWIN